MERQYKKNEKLEMIFDLVAKNFESVGPQYFTYFGHQLIERSRLTNGKTVLDVACGRGASLFKSAEIVGEEGLVTGVDFSRKMISELHETAKQNGIRNINALKMDAENLEFNDETFDYVFCGLSLHFFSNPLLSLKEMHRVLKNNGEIGISTWGMKIKENKKGVYERAYERVYSSSSSDKKSREAGNLDISSKEGLMDILERIGFSDIKMQIAKKVFYYESKEEWWNEQSNNAVRGFFERIKADDPEIFEDFKNIAFEEVGKDMIDGRIKFEAIVLYGYGEKN